MSPLRGYVFVVEVVDVSLAKDRWRTRVYVGKAADHRDRGVSLNNPVIAGPPPSSASSTFGHGLIFTRGADWRLDSACTGGRPTASSASSTIRRGLIITSRSHVTGGLGQGEGRPLSESRWRSRLRPINDHAVLKPRLITRAELSETSHETRQFRAQ